MDDTTQSPNRGRLSTDKKKKIIDFVKDKSPTRKPIRDFAKEIGCGVSTVSYYSNLFKNKKSKIGHTVQRSTVRSLRKQGMKPTDIAKNLDISVSSVYYALQSKKAKPAVKAAVTEQTLSTKELKTKREWHVSQIEVIDSVLAAVKKLAIK